MSQERQEKIIQDRIQMIVDDPQLLAVMNRFGGGVFRRSSVFHGLDRFLRANEVRGSVCFEIGTWNALTAIVLSRHFKRVVTVDIAHNAIKHEIIDSLGIKNIQCIDVVSNAYKARVAAKTNFDFAFLDGNHADDTEADFALVQRCGRVLFHEVWKHQKPVWDLVHSLPPDEVTFGGICFALWQRSTG